MIVSVCLTLPIFPGRGAYLTAATKHVNNKQLLPDKIGFYESLYIRLGMHNWVML